MLIDKKYKIRHKILEVLHEKYNSGWHPAYDVDDISLGTSEIIKNSKLTEQEIYNELEYLESAKQIHQDEDNESSSNYYVLN